MAEKVVECVGTGRALEWGRTTLKMTRIGLGEVLNHKSKLFIREHSAWHYSYVPQQQQEPCLLAFFIPRAEIIVRLRVLNPPAKLLVIIVVTFLLLLRHRHR